jgi:hypothetical protein
MRLQRSVVPVVFLVAAMVLVGCSDDGNSDDTTNGTSSRPTPGCQATGKAREQRMSVQPCTDLVDGQEVRVYASAFTPGVDVAVRICAADGASGGSGCDPNDVTTAEVGEGGSVALDYAVKKVLASKDPVDCTASSCVLTVAEVDGDERAAPVAITFAP